MEHENLFEHASEMGQILKAELEHQLADHKNVGNIRGIGLLIGIELVEDKITKAPLDVALVNKVIAHCKEDGLIIGKNGVTVAGFNNVLTLSPPLTLSIKEKDFIISKLVKAINNL